MSDVEQQARAFLALAADLRRFVEPNETLKLLAQENDGAASELQALLTQSHLERPTEGA